MAEKTGTAIGTGIVGIVLVWSAIRNQSVLSTARDIIQGKKPLPGTPQKLGFGIQTSSTSSSSTQGDVLTAIPLSGGDAHAALMNAAAAYGWNSGPQWTALDAIEMQEAGYNPGSTNPSSRAYGLAQSLGHSFAGGPAPNGINEYGGEGLTPAESLAASSGDPVPQAKWMVHYIKSRYGSPVVAEQFHLRNNWY